MKYVNVNELQNKISQIMRQVQAGEVFEVNRYSKPIAYLVPRAKFVDLISGTKCQQCLEDLRKIAKKLKVKNEKNLFRQCRNNTS